ncbi:MAG: DNA polymerase III subunit delta [Burkholderiales bacterium]|nr:DNA polymerase III subunit delta [Burkholderiales bacterium]MDE2158073.1 DNA polymerase III subunit delta [Burkholderiales bacterium]MDE2505409.1 DNA polymerase III subunit delta [Burkholderiales bacterium]
MQLKSDQLAAHLERGLRPLYTIHGDEPLLAQEAGDAIRAAARAAGYGERKVYSVSGAHFDWSAVLGAARAMSLFAERQLIEIRIPSGKPGKDGSEALQRYCERLADDVLTLVQLPRLDFQQQKAAWFTALDAAGVTLRVETIERRALPLWLGQRLARQGQRVAAGEAGQRTLAFFADRVEGNLLAAHQELQKLALLHPPGELSFEQIEDAVLDVARYDLPKLAEAVWSGAVARALRVLDALEGEGEAAVLVHWTLAEDLRALARGRAALDAGRPLPLALKDARVWGLKEKLFERVLPALAAHQLAHLLDAASICDGIVKGLRHPDWPQDAWAALRRLLLMAIDAQAPVAAPRRLALQA